MMFVINTGEENPHSPRPNSVVEQPSTAHYPGWSLNTGDCRFLEFWSYETVSKKSGQQNSELRETIPFPREKHDKRW